MDKSNFWVFLISIMLGLDIYLHISVLASVQPIYEEVFKAEIITAKAEKYFKSKDPEFPSITLIKGPYPYWKGDVDYNPNSDTIYIYISGTLLATMDRNETKAFIFHAIGHYKKGHLPKNPFEDCNFDCMVEKEKEADAFAIEKDHNVDSLVLALLINRLAFDRGEAFSRISAIENKQVQ